MKQNKKICVLDWGNISYKEAWQKQEELFRATIDRKISNRIVEEQRQTITDNFLVLCEHPHVYTLGKSGSIDNLLLDDQQLKQKGIEFFKINRGGDITYHGPGQIVGYPILDLDNFFTDIHKYLRFLEEAVIRTLAEYDIESGRLDGATGVWIEPENPAKARKICALGIRSSRWVTMHGWAFNLNTNLDYFGFIIPCGIDDKQVTSMQKELGRFVEPQEVKSKLLAHFMQLFEATVIMEQNFS